MLFIGVHKKKQWVINVTKLPAFHSVNFNNNKICLFLTPDANTPPVSELARKPLHGRTPEEVGKKASKSKEKEDIEKADIEKEDVIREDDDDNINRDIGMSIIIITLVSGIVSLGYVIIEQTVVNLMSQYSIEPWL